MRHFTPPLATHRSDGSQDESRDRWSFRWVLNGNAIRGCYRCGRDGDPRGAAPKGTAAARYGSTALFAYCWNSRGAEPWLSMSWRHACRTSGGCPSRARPRCCVATASWMRANQSSHCARIFRSPFPTSCCSSAKSPAVPIRATTSGRLLPGRGQRPTATHSTARRASSAPTCTFAR